MRRTPFIAALLSFAVAFAAPAATTPDQLGLGAHPAAPEKTARLGNDIYVRTRLVRVDTGDLAVAVRKDETVNVLIEFLPRDNAKDRPMSLICSVDFIDMKGVKTPSPVQEKPCFDGRISDASPRYQPLNAEVSFKADPKDPAGTYGVVVRVKDSYIGKQTVMVPTYGWVDGAK